MFMLNLGVIGLSSVFYRTPSLPFDGLVVVGYVYSIQNAALDMGWSLVWPNSVFRIRGNL